MKLGGSRRPFLPITTCAARHQILMLGNSAFMRTAFFCDEEIRKSDRAKRQQSPEPLSVGSAYHSRNDPISVRKIGHAGSSANRRWLALGKET